VFFGENGVPEISEHVINSVGPSWRPQAPFFRQKHPSCDLLMCYKLGEAFLAVAGAFLVRFSDVSLFAEHANKLDFAIGCLPVANISKEI
jgi:hypothetical protein